LFWLVKHKIAYVDESRDGNRIAIGIFIGDEMGAWNALRSVYIQFLKMFGIRYTYPELKLSNVLNSIRKLGYIISDKLLQENLLIKGLNGLSNYGFYRGLVVKDFKKIFLLAPKLCNKLIKAKISKRDVAYFVSIYYLISDANIDEIVLDKGLIYTLRGIKRAIKIIRWNVELKEGDSIKIRGLQVADFIAGCSRRLNVFNALGYLADHSRIFKMIDN